MLILLPPSERKAASAEGPPLDLDDLSFPSLTPVRKRLLDLLGEVCLRDDARELLDLPSGQAEEALARNRALAQAPTVPVSRLYTGVLYDNLALHQLDPGHAADRVVVFSGLWGALRLTDRVPPYRLSMNATLPPAGRPAALWRPALREALGPLAEGRLIVDMRSGPYVAAWKPKPGKGQGPGPRGIVAVRVFREQVVRGVPKRTVVSHMAKATRGRVAHDLLQAGADPESPEELLKIVAGLGHSAELNGGNLDIVLHS
mgnify:CR=1 FL=1